MPPRPEWWEWDLEISSHLLKRMAERGFNEVELRHMLAVATGLRPDIVPGRWIIATRHRRSPWEAVVEPDRDVHVVVVITAYPVER